MVNLLNQTATLGGNRASNLQKGTLLVNATQTTPVSHFANLSGRQNAGSQPGSTSNLKGQIQVLGQKYDQLNQVANNPALDAQTRQNAKAARLQVQNVYHQLNQQAAKMPNSNTQNQQQPFFSTAQTTQQPNPWQQLKARNVLHDDDIRRLFQSIQARGNSAAEKRQANLLRLYAVQKLTENTVANANRLPNGEIIIQGVPVRPEDALYFAKQDIQHFLDAQTHLKPSELLAASMVNPQTSVAIQQTVQKAAVKKSPYLSPEEAYNKIQDGKYSEIKNQKISQYYTWGDVMVSHSITSNNMRSIPLDLYKNAEKLSKALDKVSQQVGSKVPIESWIRVQSKSSNHKFGMAVDLLGTKEYLHGPVYNAVRRTPEIKGIGQSEQTWPTPGLHIDNGRGHMPPTGQQMWFNDNPGGIPFKNPTNLKLEPATSKRILRYKQ